MPPTDRGALEAYQLLKREERRACEKSFFVFFCRAWEELEPETKLTANWHMEYICDEMQSQAERIARNEPKKYDLIINVPPRSAKSRMLAICFPAWVWIQYPSQKFLTASYSSNLALEHSVECRQLIQTEWYQEHWSVVTQAFEMQGDQNQKSSFKNNKGGHRITTSVGATATGRGGNWNIIDDPLSAEQAESDVERDNAVRWLTRTMATRLNNRTVDIRVLIMQRLHENDPTGYLMRTQPEKWKLICLPAELSKDVSPPELRERYTNGLLFPARMDQAYLDSMKTDLGSYAYAGQFQQRPSPEEGGLFKRPDWVFWQLPGMQLPSVECVIGEEHYSCPVVDLPTRFDDEVCSWDMSFEDHEGTDYVVGQVWGKQGALEYLLDQDRRRLDYPNTVTAVLQMANKYPKATATLIEKKANGPAVIASLRKIVPGILPVEPRGSKYARAVPMSNKQRSHQIVLPHPALAKWTDPLIERFAAFPNVEFDDEIDAADQASDYFTRVKRVWPEYRGETKTFNVAFKKLSKASTLIISQWVGPNLETSLLLALWNARDMRLWVFDELSLSTSMPEIVVANASSLISRASGGFIKTTEPFEWYGNSLMFSKTSKAQGARAKTGYITGMYEAYNRHNVSIMANRNYDEYGAIALFSRLLTFNALKIHPRCQEFVRQVNTWGVENNKPAEFGYDMCRAACNMVTILWESGKMVEHEAKLKPYSKQKERAVEMLEKADQSNMLGDYIESGQISATDESYGSHGWM